MIQIHCSKVFYNYSTFLIIWHQRRIKRKKLLYVSRPPLSCTILFFFPILYFTFIFCESVKGKPGISPIVKRMLMETFSFRKAVLRNPLLTDKIRVLIDIKKLNLLVKSSLLRKKRLPGTYSKYFKTPPVQIKPLPNILSLQDCSC